MIKRYYGLADTFNKKDKRQLKWKKQRDERGFDDTELWNLDMTIARFILPRLKALHKLRTIDNYNEIVLALKIIAFDNRPISLDKNDVVRNGLDCLSRQMINLWY